MARRPISVEGTSASPRLRMWLDVVQRRLDLVERHQALVQRLQQPGAQLLAIEVLAAAVALHDDDAGALRSLVRRETVLHARFPAATNGAPALEITRVDDPRAGRLASGQRMTSAELLCDDLYQWWYRPQRYHNLLGYRADRLRSARLPPFASATPALVHRLDAASGNRGALLDQRCAQRLWGRQVLGPWVAITEVTQGGVDGELARRDGVEIVPGDRKRYGRAGRTAGCRRR